MGKADYYPHTLKTVSLEGTRQLAVSVLRHADKTVKFDRANGTAEPAKRRTEDVIEPVSTGGRELGIASAPNASDSVGHLNKNL